MQRALGPMGHAQLGRCPLLLNGWLMTPGPSALSLTRLLCCGTPVTCIQQLVPALIGRVSPRVAPQTGCCCCCPQVQRNIVRLMPGADPVQVLATQPQMVLDMQQAGMSSAADVEGYEKRS